MNNIVILSHKFLPQHDDDLVLYLKQKRFSNILHIYHSFSDAPDRRSYGYWYKDGTFFKSFTSSDYKFLPEPLIYLKEFIMTFLWIYTSRERWDEAISMDGLCANFSLLLKKLGKVKKAIYWAVDFVPEKRFKQRWKNKIYHIININGYLSVDEMWDLSPRMAEARKNFLGIELGSYKLLKVVPYGAWLNRIKRYSYSKCEKNTLVFMGHLLEKQGVQFVISQIPDIVKINPRFKFKIIGIGNYKDELVHLVKNLRIEKYCEFLGKIEKNEDLERIIAKSCLAIAPYVRKLDTWTYYADPGKVKTYIACGVPVLLTDLPWNAQKIEESECGKIINLESPFYKVILSWMKDNNQFRKNAIRFAESFDYNKIFDNLF